MPKIYYQDGYKYQLTHTCIGSLKRKIPKKVQFDWFEILEDGRYAIRKGYAWDGPSGPTFDTKNFMRGSLIHDMLYQAIRNDLLPQSFRKDADEILKEICLQDGMSRIRANWVYFGVKRFAKNAANPKNKRKVLEAP